MDIHGFANSELTNLLNKLIYSILYDKLNTDIIIF